MPPRRTSRRSSTSGEGAGPCTGPRSCTRLAGDSQAGQPWAQARCPPARQPRLRNWAAHPLTDAAFWPPCPFAPCRDNREAMDAIVEVLLEKETMTGDEFRAILSKYATMPQVRPAPALASPACSAARHSRGSSLSCAPSRSAGVPARAHALRRAARNRAWRGAAPSSLSAITPLSLGPRRRTSMPWRARSSRMPSCSWRELACSAGSQPNSAVPPAAAATPPPSPAVRQLFACTHSHPCHLIPFLARAGGRVARTGPACLEFLAPVCCAAATDEPLRPAAPGPPPP